MAIQKEVPRYNYVSVEVTNPQFLPVLEKAQWGVILEETYMIEMLIIEEVLPIYQWGGDTTLMTPGGKKHNLKRAPDDAFS